jgi:hypothetical protein
VNNLATINLAKVALGLAPENLNELKTIDHDNGFVRLDHQIKVASVYGGRTIDFCGATPQRFGDPASLAIQSGTVGCDGAPTEEPRRPILYLVRRERCSIRGNCSFPQNFRSSMARRWFMGTHPACSFAPTTANWVEPKPGRVEMGLASAQHLVMLPGWRRIHDLAVRHECFRSPLHH